MSYFPRRRAGFLAYLVVALVAAIAGGVVALALAPSFYAPLTGHPPAGQVQPLERQEAAPPPRPAPAPPPAAVTPSPVVAIAERVGPAVVGVANFKGYDLYRRPVVASGSGIVIDSRNGYVVTNYHVVEGFRGLAVTVDGEHEYEAELVGGDPQTDLAVLRVKAPGLRQATLGDSDRLRVGETVVAIGNPLGRQFARSVTAGVVSALDREITVESRPGQEVTLRVIQTDAAINPGNSGGALVNASGEVIGINSVKIAATGVEGMGFAIPINDARPVIDRLIRDGRVRRPFLGISFFAITPGMARWYAIERGLMVESVLPHGPAEEAGLKPGDIILALNGKTTTTAGDLGRFLDRHRPGDRVRVEVARGKRRLTLILTLSEAPSEGGD